MAGVRGERSAIVLCFWFPIRIEHNSYRARGSPCPHLYHLYLMHVWSVSDCMFMLQTRRIRINTEEMAKVVAAVWRTEFILVLAALFCTGIIY